MTFSALVIEVSAIWLQEYMLYVIMQHINALYVPESVKDTIEVEDGTTIIILVIIFRVVA